MLPNIQSLKNELQEIINRHIRSESHRKMGALSLSPVQIIHEGDQMRTLRADGSSDVSDMKMASGEVSIPTSKVGTLTIEERAKLIDELSEGMAKQMATHFYGEIDRVLEATGQVVSQAGMTPLESVFAVFEKVHLDFDESGNIKGLVISAGAGAIEGLKKVEEQITSDPAISQRWEELMERKREEWRAREASRKLVG
ncbi:hypothetical protein E2F46_16480 [Luteimonas aestuarii]|uniref:Uncharacterized protein n=1 Tax=Luteimonas aestuarii TaxID=453837 RepID=A0A4R5TIH7_9GAMM|nr:hypothetical protein [Luteimonas aestuarii]TDK19963.1 hypothetical protein E2F46_16480 [Luteimonas aestuarii]